MRSSRVGGAASHSRDGTAMDVLMEHAGCRFATISRSTVWVATAAAAAGGHAFWRNDFYRGGRPYVAGAVLHFDIQHPRGSIEAALEARVEFWVQ